MKITCAKCNTNNLIDGILQPSLNIKENGFIAICKKCANINDHGKFREISDEEWDVSSDLMFGKDRYKPE